MPDFAVRDSSDGHLILASRQPRTRVVGLASSAGAGHPAVAPYFLS
uniref:Uncharacterized protein n=1 Tax=Arundo donax TaxID=35708 RepID=A0A0A8Y996_ARUDO